MQIHYVKLWCFNLSRYGFNGLESADVSKNGKVHNYKVIQELGRAASFLLLLAWSNTSYYFSPWNEAHFRSSLKWFCCFVVLHTIHPEMNLQRTCLRLSSPPAARREGRNGGGVDESCSGRLSVVFQNKRRSKENIFIVFHVIYLLFWKVSKTACTQLGYL